MRQRKIVGFLVIGAAVAALWSAGFYDRHAPSPGLPTVTTWQPDPQGSGKAKVPHVPHARVRPVRLFTGGGWGGGNNGSGQ